MTMTMSGPEAARTLRDLTAREAERSEQRRTPQAYMPNTRNCSNDGVGAQASSQGEPWPDASRVCNQLHTQHPSNKHTCTDAPSSDSRISRSPSSGKSMLSGSSLGAKPRAGRCFPLMICFFLWRGTSKGGAAVRLPRTLDLCL